MTQFCGQTVASYWEIKNQKKFPIDSWNQFCKIRKRSFHYLRSEIRNQKSEIRNRKSEIGNKITSHLRDVGYYVGSTHNALYPTILPCMWRGGRKGGGEGMTEWESFRRLWRHFRLFLSFWRERKMSLSSSQKSDRRRKLSHSVIPSPLSTPSPHTRQDSWIQSIMGRPYVIANVTQVTCDLISDFRFPISDFRFLISDLWFLISDFWFPISDFGFLISDFWFLISHFRFLISDFWFLISDFRFLISDFWFPISGFGFRVSDFKRISDFSFQMTDLR